MVHNAGIKTRKAQEEIRPKEVQKILKELEGMECEPYFSRLFQRETVKLKKAEYMKEHIGEVFEGIISGVTEWGIYVELENTVEGLVHVNSMTGDYYTFDREQYRLTGDMTKKTYTMGQKVRVRVENADLQTKTVDFVLEREE